MSRNWVELHKTLDPNILKGIVTFVERDDFVPQSSPNSVVIFFETTGRIDGPFGKDRQYNISGDLFEDFVPPPPPPPTQEETELDALVIDDATDKQDMIDLFALPIVDWTQPDRDSAAKMSLRKLEIIRLQTIVDKQ